MRDGKRYRFNVSKNITKGQGPFAIHRPGDLSVREAPKFTKPAKRAKDADGRSVVVLPKITTYHR